MQTNLNETLVFAFAWMYEMKMMLPSAILTLKMKKKKTKHKNSISLIRLHIQHSFIHVILIYRIAKLTYKYTKSLDLYGRFLVRYFVSRLFRCCECVYFQFYLSLIYNKREFIADKFYFTFWRWNSMCIRAIHHFIIL